MKYSGTNIQLIEIPAIGSEYYDSGLVNSADVILIMITSLDDINKILSQLDKAHGRKLIIFNIENIMGDIIMSIIKKHLSNSITCSCLNFFF